MNKEVFLHQLRIRLSQLPEKEILKSLDYYDELIDDMVEDGMSEEEAVSELGDINEIAQKILVDAPFSTLVKTKVKPKKGWTPAAIALAVIGAPIWVPLLLAFIMVVLSVYVVCWSLIIAVYACVGALGITAVYLLIKAFTLFSAGLPAVIFTIGIAILSAGLCLLVLLGAKVLTMGMIDFSKWIFRQIKGLFVKKEA